MRHDVADRIAAEARDAGAEDVQVLRSSGGAPEPNGYVVLVEGRRISTPATWRALRGAEESANREHVFNLRPSPRLLADLRRLAFAHQRSLHAEIIAALENYASQSGSE